MPVSVAGKSKIQTKDYKNAGTYPIVDQSQTPIAGWTDSLDAVIDNPLPLIVFGDHSRTFKYVDVAFARGADGTQLLRPADEIDPLFFFYACRAIDLVSRGYNRHFTLLKEKEVSYPKERADQRSIASLLARAERAVAVQNELIGLLQQTKSSSMQQLFSHGLRGETLKQTANGPIPESWELVALGDLGRIGNGSTPKRSNSAYWEGGTFPWLNSARVYDRDIRSADQFVTDVALKECHLPVLEPGAVLVAITGQGKTLGNAAILNVRATINQHLAYLQTNLTKADPGFVRAYLETQYDYLRAVAAGGGSTKGALTCGFLRGMVMPMPMTLDEQKEIVGVLDGLDRKIDLHSRKRDVLDQLFRSLLHRFMTGDISIEDLDLSALPVAEGSAA